MNTISYGSAERHCDKQLASIYALYVIGGSWYDKCMIKNRMLETQLKLNYASLKINEQYGLEEKTETLIRGTMDRAEASDLHAECIVSFNGRDAVVEFFTGIIDRCFTVKPGGFIDEVSEIEHSECAKREVS